MISSEFDIIRRFFAGRETGNNVNRADVTLGIGDDAALLTPPAGQSLVVTADTLVSGVHFSEDTRPGLVAYKSLAVNLSDLAAMGAEPAWFTLCITLPRADEDWLIEFAQGLFDLASEHGIQLVGGDTTHGPLSITVQAMGLVPEGMALTRSGAKPGDAIYVTGTLGDAGAGLQIQQGLISAGESVASELLDRLERPTPRITAGMALRDLASAAIDVSDGLSADLGHIIDASEVGADVFVDDIPLSGSFKGLSLSNARQLALSNGDDYELCFTASAENEKEVQQRLAALDCRCTRIGTITPRAGAIRWLDTAGNEHHWKLKSYDHFSQD